MQLGVIADTHDNVFATRAAVDLFSREGAETVIHCGDVIAPPVLDAFAGMTVHLVLGNNDGEREGLRAAIDALGRDSQLHGRFARLSFDEITVAVLHGEDLDEVAAYAETGAFDYVLHGHHHEAYARAVGSTTILNPGAHFPTVPEEHRSVAMIDTDQPGHRFESIEQ